MACPTQFVTPPSGVAVASAPPESLAAFAIQYLLHDMEATEEEQASCTKKLTSVFKAANTSLSVVLHAMWFVEQFRHRAGRSWVPTMQRSNSLFHAVMGTGPCSDVALSDDVPTNYRILIAAIVVANKFCEDQTYTNRAWTTVAGIHLSDLNILEIRIISVLQFDLHIPEHTYSVWLRHLLVYLRLSSTTLTGVPQSIAAAYAATSGSPLSSPFTPRRKLSPASAIPFMPVDMVSASPSPPMSRRISPPNLVPFVPLDMRTAAAAPPPLFDESPALPGISMILADNHMEVESTPAMPPAPSQDFAVPIQFNYVPPTLASITSFGRPAFDTIPSHIQEQSFFTLPSTFPSVPADLSVPLVSLAQPIDSRGVPTTFMLPGVGVAATFPSRSPVWISSPAPVGPEASSPYENSMWSHLLSAA